MKKRICTCRLGGLFLLSTLLAGCGGFGDSLRLRKTVLVKMPFKEPIKEGQGRGWHFRHVLQAPTGFWRDGQWYVAWNDTKPISSGPLNPYWVSIDRRAPELADAAFAAFHSYPILIEPNRTFTKFATSLKDGPPPKDEQSEPGSLRRVVASKLPSGTWPNVKTPEGKFDPLWHLGDRYTELASARRVVGAPKDGRRIRIGHLDNGYDRRQAGLPRHMIHAGQDGNAVGLLAFAQGLNPTHPAPGDTGSPHGTGTLGILARGADQDRGPDGEGRQSG